MIRFVLSILGGIFSLVTIGALFAALTIGGVFWMYGRDLPDTDQLAQYQPPTVSRIYSGEGRIIDEFATERRLFVPAEEIPDLVKAAFISAEDKTFYQHQGYDPMGMLSAAVDAARGGAVRGASTITQQVMKNFLLGGERSAERKVKELILASRIEDTLSKEKILELYMNEIFLGQNSFGVAAAAQTYFNKPLADLTPAEAAYLAALPKAPSTYHPVRARDRAIERRNYVLGQMRDNGYLDRAAYEAAIAAPLDTVQGGQIDSFKSALPPRDYFTDEIRRQLSRDYGEGEFLGGGLAVRATIDPDLQDDAAEALRRALEQYDRGLGRWRGSGKTIPPEQLDNWREALAETEIARDIHLENEWFPAVVLGIEGGEARLGIEGWAEGDPDPVVPAKDVEWTGKPMDAILSVGDVVHVRAMTADEDGAFIRWTLRQVPAVQGAFMAMDVHTGRVLAMQGGFSYQHSVFNRATQATRQPGSAFKPFVYAAALDSGFTPATIVVDAPIEVNTPQGLWRPKNYSNRFYGPTPLRTGIEQSRNLMTVRLAEEMGMDTVARYAERFGVYDNMGRYLANSLGAEETTLYKMVAAYAMFANGGERVEPTLVDRVQDRYGKTVYRHDRRTCVDCLLPSLPPGKGPQIVSENDQVMNAITAYQLTSMLKGVVERGTARGKIDLGVPTAGKTGTTNDEKDAWFVGFTSNIAAGCYIGYDRPRPMGRSGSGGGLCAPVFNSFMKAATAKYGGGPFRIPPGGRFINIDRFTGARLSDDATGDNVVAEYFRLGEEPLFGVAYDGGFAMGANLPLYQQSGGAQQVRSGGGGTAVIPGRKATFGSMSSGGLY
ncbi:penicillin-binding protein 1A [Oceaniovalibus guishaninsula JLT2003]|uniref:Penicillin-binding protein 1A n=1 Tax=Oceaniovalibus guishaninsula JLT2003 TaxID=1231392 RepID=K2I814_9RHOB|nr:PBP1A family penicillin-binding protein [Oceaniovalibus guishaninsula]EKE45135.1 penicillin-binding protein 1A [Oceaniovalibus guishaninsula JLT2003]